LYILDGQSGAHSALTPEEMIQDDEIFRGLQLIVVAEQRRLQELNWRTLPNGAVKDAAQDIGKYAIHEFITTLQQQFALLAQKHKTLCG
jgi:hypothetical protein